jgi:hemerythrin-like domain-containing protein
MSRSAIEKIRREHRAIAQVLRHFIDTLRAIKPGQAKRADFELINNMIYYIRVFPDRLHHPKEEETLFKALRQAAPEALATLDLLKREHYEGEQKLRAIQQALDQAEKDGGEVAFAELRGQVEAYVEFEFRHMRREEEEVLPLAEARVPDQDWDAIERAFAENHDPVFGQDVELAFDSLRKRIMDFPKRPARG